MRIYVAGHRGMVGGAILRRLQAEGGHDILTRTSAELDLRDQAALVRQALGDRRQAVFAIRTLPTTRKKALASGTASGREYKYPCM